MLSVDELKVVRFDLTTSDWLESDRWLDEGEREHAESLYFDADRDEYRRSHAGLRQALAAELATNPSSPRFIKGRHGKPQLSDSGLQFSLSHSAGVALVAIAHRAVGVDAERIREGLAEDVVRLYSPAERAALASLPEDQRSTAFFRAWVRKEAVLKARGTGLTVPLDDFDVTLAPDQPARLLATRPDAAVAASWTLADVPVQPGWVAAVAVAAGRPLRLSVVDAHPDCHRWSG